MIWRQITREEARLPQHPPMTVAVCDSDWGSQHSTAVWAVFVAGISVAYASKKERCVALSSTEAEINAASMCACDIMYIRMLLEHVGFPPRGPTPLCCDNKGVTDITRDRQRL